MVVQDEVREGMVVRDMEGRKVGRVRAVGETHFELEPRLLSRDEFLVEFSDVRYARDGELYLERTPHLLKLEDDDGGALPPRHHHGMDSEPVNVEDGEASHSGL
ncbi:hypothetical protein ATI61_12728 [Archangium gephyra]|uniref:DUF2171 domain-containing protein n=1 Tax=Archangium gephyra TaxID=48 RepID=A0AAC8QJI8_9BACT|nr:hypothetical protein [Archangium gephyra]AKJ08406.1 Hypothetical protein AA314_10032 [Archangium gephyra]REG14309.1 hypothetical protein ATI61_12728 [Archangium gephyra]